LNVCWVFSCLDGDDSCMTLDMDYYCIASLLPRTSTYSVTNDRDRGIERGIEREGRHLMVTAT
jgi:hypothetical protein